MTTRRLAAVDCGTNSLRLLVADLDAESGQLVDVVRRMEVVRLGQGVDATGELHPDAIARTREALTAYAAEIRRLDVSAVRMVATSATRDARNRDDFVAMVCEVLGQEPDVASGAEEAALSFRGATSGLAQPVDLPTLVVDIGGGSTELVLGAGEVQAAASVNTGCVRLTERHQPSDPATPDQIEAMHGDARTSLATAAQVVPVGQARSLIGVAGTVTTVAGVALGLDSYQPELLHGARMTAAEVRRVSAELLTMTRAERAALGCMHPGRVDVIAAGSVVLVEVLALTGATELVVSEHDILDGIVWSLADRR